MTTLLFFRNMNGKEHFYPVEVPKSVRKGRSLKQIAADHAKLNPGTLRVETVMGRVLWRVDAA